MTNNDMTIEIVSVWGRTTTKAMRHAVARVREEYQRNLDPAYAGRFARLYALKEINVRFEKCGEAINREMVARVGEHYGANIDDLWSFIIEPYGGSERVSPKFELSPIFLDPRLKG